MNTKYEVTDHITPEEYMEMRKIVGWHAFPVEQAAEGLKHTDFIYCLRDNGKPIALGRAFLSKDLLNNSDAVCISGSKESRRNENAQITAI